MKERLNPKENYHAENPREKVPLDAHETMEVDGFSDFPGFQLPPVHFFQGVEIFRFEFVFFLLNLGQLLAAEKRIPLMTKMEKE